ncbi:hypothetical protein IAU60_002286 [Kwoniella sp. DSM 27419]
MPVRHDAQTRHQVEVVHSYVSWSHGQGSSHQWRVKSHHSTMSTVVVEIASRRSKKRRADDGPTAAITTGIDGFGPDHA